MIKVIVAIPKRADLTDDQFHHHWIEPHGRIALRIRAMRRYVQSHRIRYPGLASHAGPYDGFAEVWLDDLQTARGLGQDPDYREHLVPDEPNFCNVTGLVFTIFEEQPIADFSPHASTVEPFKIIQLVRRHENVNTADFRAAFVGNGDAIVALRPLHFVHLMGVPGTPAPHLGFDGAREVWWPNSAAFEAARQAAPESWRRLVSGPKIDPEHSLIDAVREIRFL